MRFIYQKYGIDFIFSEFQVFVLVVENTDAFTDLFYDLWKQSNGNEGKVIISENEKIRQLNKCLEVIINPFELDINNKKILSAVYNDLNFVCKEYYSEIISGINSKMIEFFDTLEKNVEYNLTYDLEVDVKNFFKTYNLKLETEENENDLLGMLVTYIKLMHRICNIDIFIFSNLKGFLNKLKFEDFCKECKYEEVKIIDIEAFRFNSCTKEEKCIIIDKDLCIIEID